MHAKKECVTISSLLVIPRLILNGLTHDLKKVRINYVRGFGRYIAKVCGYVG